MGLFSFFSFFNLWEDTLARVSVCSGSYRFVEIGIYNVLDGQCKV